MTKEEQWFKESIENYIFAYTGKRAKISDADAQHFTASVMSYLNLCTPSLPSNLDEVTMDFARELDFFLYGSYTPERFPHSMQVRDEHSGFRVNDWKCWVNKPELKIEMVKHFFTLGKQAGAEWMAGQGYSQEEIVEDKSIEIGYGVLSRDISNYQLPDSFKPGDKVVVQIRKSNVL